MWYLKIGNLAQNFPLKYQIIKVVYLKIFKQKQKGEKEFGY